MSELYELLSMEEKERAQRFFRRRDSRRFIVAHGALRLLLAESLGDRRPQAIQFAAAKNGKPYLTGSRLRFNLSHSGELALVALAQEREVGIDVEESRAIADALRIAETCFSPGEIERVARVASDPAKLTRSFLECWTRKEAFVKAVGQGLSYPLNSFEVSFYPDKDDRLHLPREQGGIWHLRNLDATPGFYAAVVFAGHSRADPARVGIHDWHSRSEASWPHPLRS